MLRKTTALCNRMNAELCIRGESSFLSVCTYLTKKLFYKKVDDRYIALEKVIFVIADFPISFSLY